MNCIPANPAALRYTYRFLSAAMLYVAGLFTAVWAFTHRHPTGATAYLLALLPAIPILAMLVIVGIYLGEEKDEFQRNLTIQAMIWSIGATLAVTTVWGFLENFLTVPHLQLYLIFPLFSFFVGVATAALKLRYR